MSRNAKVSSLPAFSSPRLQSLLTQVKKEHSFPARGSTQAKVKTMVNGSDSKTNIPSGRQGAGRVFS